MFHHSGSRNHRSKGSNVKKILQVVVLLAVACWLLYQVKHSRDKKAEYSGNGDKKLSKGGDEISLGRKGDAGSENVIIIDTNAQDSDEIAEINQDEQHSSDLNGEDQSKEIPRNLELEDSKESNSNNGEKDGTQEEHADSHVNDEEETLHLPNERDNNVVATITENAGMKNEQENGEASNQEMGSSDDETRKGEGAGSDNENIKSVSETSDDNKIDHADGNANSDDDHVRSSTNDEAGDSTEFNSDTSLQNDNIASKEGEVDESQLENAPEVENADSEGEMKINTESKKDAENSSSNEEVQNSSDASSNVSVESQSDKTSDAEGQETSSEARQTDNEDGKVEIDSEKKVPSEKSSEGVERNGSDDRQKDSTAGNAGESQENRNENPTDATGSDPGNEISGTGNQDQIFNEEGNGEAISSNEKINSDDSGNEIPAGEPVQAAGGNKSEAESTNDGSTGEVTTDLNPKIETKRDSTNPSAEGEASEEKAVL